MNALARTRGSLRHRNRATTGAETGGTLGVTAHCIEAVQPALRQKSENGLKCFVFRAPAFRFGCTARHASEYHRSEAHLAAIFLNDGMAQFLQNFVIEDQIHFRHSDPHTSILLSSGDVI